MRILLAAGIAALFAAGTLTAQAQTTTKTKCSKRAEADCTAPDCTWTRPLPAPKRRASAQRLRSSLRPCRTCRVLSRRGSQHLQRPTPSHFSTYAPGIQGLRHADLGRSRCRSVIEPSIWKKPHSIFNDVTKPAWGQGLELSPRLRMSTTVISKPANAGQCEQRSRNRRS
jgi:hypothetical protein